MEGLVQGLQWVAAPPRSRNGSQSFLTLGLAALPGKLFNPALYLPEWLIGNLLFSSEVFSSQNSFRGKKIFLDGCRILLSYPL